MDPQNPLANLDPETQQKIQEIQILEQNFQQLMMQKQAFSHESTETDFALTELEKAEGDVFKIVANQLIIKSTKEKIQEEMKHKKGLLDTRLKNIEKQEEDFSGKLEKLREEIMKKIAPQEATDDKKAKK